MDFSKLQTNQGAARKESTVRGSISRTRPLYAGSQGSLLNWATSLKTILLGNIKKRRGTASGDGARKIDAGTVYSTTEKSLPRTSSNSYRLQMYRNHIQWMRDSVSVFRKYPRPSKKLVAPTYGSTIVRDHEALRAESRHRKEALFSD